MIPDRWKTIELNQLVSSLDSGVSVNAEDRQASEDEIGVLKISSVSYGQFNPKENKAVLSEEVSRVSFNPFKTQEFITKLGLENSSSNLIPKGTVIIPTRMALGKAVIYQVDVTINQDLKAIFPKKDIDTLYLYYWLQNQAKHICKISSGSTVKGILLSDLKNIKFLQCPLPEQEKIAAVLSAADEEISKLEKQLAAYKQQKLGLMQQLLTGRIRI